MCKLKSVLILKDRVYCSDYDSHDRMLHELGITDNMIGTTKTFVRAELSPADGNVFSAIESWEYKVDQDVLPDWYDPIADEARVREAVKLWAEDHILINRHNIELHDGAYYISNSTVNAYDNCRINAFNYSRVNAYNYSMVNAYNYSMVNAYNYSMVNTYNYSMVNVCNYSTVNAYNYSMVNAYDYSRTEACNYSTVNAYNNSKVNAFDYSRVNACVNSMVDAYGDSTINAYGDSTINAYGNSTIIKGTHSQFDEGWLLLGENATYIDHVKHTVINKSYSLNSQMKDNQ